jgi:hypothetical protein
MDLLFELIDMRDEQTVERDGRTVVHQKVVRFYLGKFGPFTERFPATVTSAEIQGRVEAVRTTIRGLPS